VKCIDTWDDMVALETLTVERVALATLEARPEPAGHVVPQSVIAFPWTANFAVQGAPTGHSGPGQRQPVARAVSQLHGAQRLATTESAVRSRPQLQTLQSRKEKAHETT